MAHMAPAHERQRSTKLTKRSVRPFLRQARFSGGVRCMTRPSVLIGSVLLLAINSAAWAAPNPTQAPCANGVAGCSSEDAQRLNSAFMSDITTDAQRAKMASVVASHTTSGKTDWTAAANEYFAWRAQTMGYVQPPAVAPPRPDYEQAQREAKSKEIERQRSLRSAAEAAVRARLVDPDSARFEWPYGFTRGGYKPFLQKRIFGNVTCGIVNARNRMGGYAGSHSFAVVLDDSGVPLYVEIGTDDRYDITDAQCEKAASWLPPAPPELAEPSASTGANVTESVADQLEKLAALRDRGVLTDSEFQAQKAKLLGEHP